MAALGASGVCMDAYEATTREFVDYLNEFGDDCSYIEEFGSAACHDQESADIYSGSYRSFYRRLDGVYEVFPGYDLYPVVVSWYGARAFCAQKGRRLCTLDEYGDACAGAEGRRYPYGDEYVYCACAFGSCGGLDERTHRVGAFPACEGGYPGLFDVLGNMGETTSTCYVKWGFTGEEPAEGLVRICYTGRGSTPDLAGGIPMMTCEALVDTAETVTARYRSGGFRCCLDLE
jgi:formylglycine-generating enzyme required for sulfatase activity